MNRSSSRTECKLDASRVSFAKECENSVVTVNFPASKNILEEENLFCLTDRSLFTEGLVQNRNVFQFKKSKNLLSTVNVVNIHDKDGNKVDIKCEMETADDFYDEIDNLGL